MKYKLSIRISIRPSDYSGSGLEIHEEVELAVEGFMEMCKVLGKFDELAKQIKKEKG